VRGGIGVNTAPIYYWESGQGIFDCGAGMWRYRIPDCVL